MNLLWILVFNLWPVWVGLIVYYKYKKSKSDKPPEPGPYKQSLSSVNEVQIRQKIVAEIRAQSATYNTKSQQKVVEEMAQTVEYFGVNAYAPQPALNSVQTENAYSPSMASEITVDTPSETPSPKLDSATTLLYLGAFLLLASIGLYVGVGSGDSVKSLLVTVISAVFYGGGLYLYSNSTRLKPAGQTFASIGMATLPMAGAAIYYYGLQQTHGPAVWLVTSIVAVGMYAYAIWVLRSALVSYLLVFSTLSVMFSGISALGLAPFYMIHGLGLFGLITAVCIRTYGSKDSTISVTYGRSAMFMVPFSVVASLLSFATMGWVNVSLSLLLAAAYYGYEYLYGVYKEQVYSLLAQIAAISSLLCAVYSASHTATAVALVAGLCAALYSIIWYGRVCKKPADNMQRKYVKYILLGLPLLSIGLMMAHISHAWIAVLLLAVVSSVVYSTDRDVVSGMLLVSSLLVLPYFVAVLGIETPVDSRFLANIYLAIATLAVALKLLARKTATATDRAMLLYMTIVPLCLSATMSTEMLLAAKAVFASAQVLIVVGIGLSEKRRSDWFAGAALVQAFWLLGFVSNPGWIFAFTVFVIATNALFALLPGSLAIHGWIVSIGLLSLPVQYGEMQPKQLGYGAYRNIYLTYAYLLVAARYALRKVIVVRSKLYPVWFGYFVAIAAAITLAISGPSISVAACLFLAGIFLVAVSYVESSAEVIVPAFLCGYASVLYLLVYGETRETFSVAVVVAISQMVYWLLSMSGLVTVRAKYARYTQLAIAAAVPIAGLQHPTYGVYAVALACFGGILAKEIWSKNHQSKELSLLLLHMAVLWLLYASGVRELQVYTHLSAAFVALLAYMRASIGAAKELVSQYVWAAVLIFSVPLVLQALAAGKQIYSYLALIEHVLLIVVALERRYKSVVWYSIAVVVGSVMYQLRTYKYAALAVLGVFVIGIAIYYLSRSAPEDNK